MLAKIIAIIGILSLTSLADCKTTYLQLLDTKCPVGFHIFQGDNASYCYKDKYACTKYAANGIECLSCKASWFYKLQIEDSKNDNYCVVRWYWTIGIVVFISAMIYLMAAFASSIEKAKMLEQEKEQEQDDDKNQIIEEKPA